MDNSLQWLAGHPPPPFPAPSFFFSVLAPTYADNWIENVASQAIGLSRKLKGFQDAYTHIYYSMNLNYFLTKI